MNVDIEKMVFVAFVFSPLVFFMLYCTVYLAWRRHKELKEFEKQWNNRKH